MRIEPTQGGVRLTTTPQELRRLADELEQLKLLAGSGQLACVSAVTPVFHMQVVFDPDTVGDFPNETEPIHFGGPDEVTLDRELQQAIKRAQARFKQN